MISLSFQIEAFILDHFRFLFSQEIKNTKYATFTMTSTLLRTSIVILLGVLDFFLALSLRLRACMTNPYAIVDSVTPRSVILPKRGKS